MQAGDVYWVDVPFEDDPARSKRRSFVILHVAADTVLGLRGTGQTKPQLTLALSIDPERPSHAAIRIPGVGNYYCENLRELSRNLFRDYRGSLPKHEIYEVIEIVNRWLQNRNI